MKLTAQSSPKVRPMKAIANLVPAFLIALVLLAPTRARSDVELFTDPGDIMPDENLQFNDPGLEQGPALTIQGATNQSDRVLDIMATVNLVSPAAGQARVEAEGGVLFGAGGVMFIPHSADDLPDGLNPMESFTELEFNINAAEDGTVSFVVETETETLLFGPEDVDAAGENFFAFQATAGQVITKVTITTSGNIIEDIRQIRIGGFDGNGNGPGPGNGDFIPEPASMIVWTMIGLGGLLGARRRNRRSPEETTA